MAPERPWNLWDESTPIPVENGFAAKGQVERPTMGLGGSIVRRVLDRTSPGIATRGRSYAKAGQIATLDYEPGRIVADVQGSDELPYLTEITFTVPEEDRRRFIRALHHALPAPVTAVPETSTRELTAELAQYRILVDAPLTVRCNCSHRGVCKHLVALAYVAGELLDESPVNIGAILGVTDADLNEPEPEEEPEEAGEPDVPVFDRRRHAQLGRTLASLEKRDAPDRDEVFARAVAVLHPSAAVANALDLDLYLDPVDEDPAEDE